MNGDDFDIPKRTERVNIRLTTAQKARLHEAAKAEGLNTTELLFKCIKEYLDRHHSSPSPGTRRARPRTKSAPSRKARRKDTR